MASHTHIQPISLWTMESTARVAKTSPDMVNACTAQASRRDMRASAGGPEGDSEETETDSAGVGGMGGTINLLKM